MKKKLGPLEVWQWLAIGVAIGLAYYLYERHEASSNSSSSTGATPADAADNDSLGPIDPTTGEPYALEGGGSGSNGSTTATQNSGPTSLEQELSDLQAIESLQANAPTPSAAAPVTTADPATASGAAGQNAVSTAVGTGTQAPGTIITHKGGPFYDYYQKVTGHAPPATVSVTNVVYEMWKAGVKATTAAAAKVTTKAPAHNPGHTVTTSSTGKKTVSSSAPANDQQHKNVAPPSHQRANPTKHPSATKTKKK